MNPTLPALLARARHLLDASRVPEALQAYRELLRFHSLCADGWYEFGWLLRRAGAPEQALSAYGRALATGIKDPEQTHLNRAVILSEDLASPDQAEAELERALLLRPDFSPALLNLGKLKEDRGDAQAAVEVYDRLSQARSHPELALEGLTRLVLINPPHEAQPHRLSRLRQTAEDRGAPPELRARAWFALGRCEESMARYDDAFAAFAEGNRLAAETSARYRPEALERHVDALIANTPGARQTCNQQFPEPLFICGMFRSGSTLLEQVLNAHPGVLAGGELAFFPRMASGPLAPYVSGSAIPEDLANHVRRDYRAVLNRLQQSSGRSNVRWLIDKRPDNILLLGLLRRLFPSARVVITRRNPMDTGLSVFQQHLDLAQAPYSSSLNGIAHYIAQVERIARHASVAWQGFVHVFDYDGFVRNPESELRPLLAWLGLEWDSACLRFHEQRNLVTTASHAQVRRPLYREASGRWERYRVHLTPLAKALAALGMSTDQTPSANIKQI